MCFTQRQVLDDCLSLIHFYLLHGKSTNCDKPKLKQSMEYIFQNYLSIPAPSPSSLSGGPVLLGTSSSSLFTRSSLESLLTIEQLLYPKSYSYADCVLEKNEGKIDDGFKERALASLLGKVAGRSKDNRNDDKEAEDDEEEPREDKEDDEEELDEKDDEMEEMEEGEKGTHKLTEKDDEIDEIEGEEDDYEKQFDDIIRNEGSESNKGEEETDNMYKAMRYQDKEHIEGDKEAYNRVVQIVPKTMGQGKLFYGGQPFYICLRFFYTLYERILKAYELSSEIERNDKTMNLSEEERREIASERYNLFKILLMSLIKDHLDPTVYEDSLRCIFGSDAGIFFTTDRIINNLIKSIPTDETSISTFQENSDIFKNEEIKTPLNEEIKLNRIILKTASAVGGKNGKSASSAQNAAMNVFRFFYDCNKEVIYINCITHFYKNWNTKSISNNRKYFEKFVSDQQPSLLSMRYRGVYKAKALKQGKRNYSSKSIYIRNMISYKSKPNSFMLIPHSHSTEDIFFRTNRERDEVKTICNAMSKVIKFRKWLIVRTKGFGITAQVHEINKQVCSQQSAGKKIESNDQTNN